MHWELLFLTLAVIVLIISIWMGIKLGKRDSRLMINETVTAMAPSGVHNRLKFDRTIIPQVAAIGMLFFSFMPSNPYGYYVLLRIVVCAVCLFLAFRAFTLAKVPWVWILGVTAFVYNPVISIHLTRELWSLVNVVTVAILGITTSFLRGNEENRQSNDPEGQVSKFNKVPH